MVKLRERIVAGSYAPGAVLSEVGRRDDISPQHLFVWRKVARAGELILPTDDAPSPNVDRPSGCCPPNKRGRLVIKDRFSYQSSSLSARSALRTFQFL
jgi:transposase-like protein